MANDESALTSQHQNNKIKFHKHTTGVWLEVWSEHPKHTGPGEMAEMVVHLEYLKSPKSPTQVTALCTAITTGHVLMCGRNCRSVVLGVVVETSTGLPTVYRSGPIKNEHS
eukprot:c20812_g3_i11.p1 GENE.c20812_g3_i11~~c20812_g3_i11.p1  ORF type:complete len:111 (-),score=26.10 c20812_g3_i11:74-406(-)